MESINGALKDLSETKIYERIYGWIQSNAKKALQDRQTSQESYENVTRLIEAMPKPDAASSADRDIIFSEVLSGHFEYFYMETDENSVKLSEYARHALTKKYEMGLHDARLSANVKKSPLYLHSFKKFVEDQNAES